MPYELKRKTFPFKFSKAEEDSETKDGIIEGYASTFGNVDLGMDIVDKGAFLESLNEDKHVPVLADHMSSRQIGWNLDGKEDDHGLFVKGELDIAVNDDAMKKFSLAKKAVKLGAKAGISIGYFILDSAPDKDNPSILHLKKLKLVEYSLVTFPMNTQAMVTDAKSVDSYIATLLGHGYSLEEIQKSLDRATGTEFSENEFAKCFDEGLNNLREVI